MNSVLYALMKKTLKSAASIPARDTVRSSCAMREKARNSRRKRPGKSVGVPPSSRRYMSAEEHQRIRAMKRNSSKSEEVAWDQGTEGSKPREHAAAGRDQQHATATRNAGEKTECSK